MLIKQINCQKFKWSENLIFQLNKTCIHKEVLKEIKKEEKKNPHGIKKKMFVNNKVLPKKPMKTCWNCIRDLI